MTTYTGEQGYLDMLTYIMENGIDKSDRTGTGTREVFAQTLRFDLSDGTIPIYTTKQVFWKTAVKELLWMLSGSRNIRPLLEQDVHIWSEWPHRRYQVETGDTLTLSEFEARILTDLDFAEVWGDTGGAYGWQWRNWETYTYHSDSDLTGTALYAKGQTIDQIQQIINTLKNNPDSRRIILEGWNVAHLDEMMLPPCHKTYQFLTGNGKLNLFLHIRSQDCFLGNPFNVVNAAVLLLLMALHTDLEPGELVISMTSAHVYSNHFDQVNLQRVRTPTDSPRMVITKQATLFDQTIFDFEVVGYTHQGNIRAEVAV